MDPKQKLANQILKKKLIYAVKKYPVIYKFDLPESKNHANKILAWQAIADELHEEVNFLKTKWKNLRDTYKKCKQVQFVNGICSTKPIKGKWARHLRFLDDTISIQNIQTVAVKEEVTSGSEEVENDLEITAVNNRETSILSAKMQAETESSERIEPNSHEVYIQNPTEIKHLEANRLHNDDDKVEVRCDRVDLLFLGFADMYKKLSHKAQVTSKFNIAKVIMDAELSDLQDHDKDYCLK